MDKAALKGIRIADFTWAWAGPYATLLLSSLGAEVIKIESRSRLDHCRMRSLGGGPVPGPDQSPVFNDINPNKLSITLDLKQPRAAELAKRLVRVSDVATENMRPGTLDKLGLGYKELSRVKPDIIMLSSSACGGAGPESRYVGYAPTFGASGGLSCLTGYPDGRPMRLMGAMDLMSATTSALAILAALYHRARTGQGQHIDLSSQETVAALLGEAMMDYSMNRRCQARSGNRDPVAAPHNVYPCRGQDAWVAIAVYSEEEWQGLLRAMAGPAWGRDEKFADAFQRHQHQEELDGHIAAWTRGLTPWEVTQILQREGVAAFPSLTSADLYQDPHLQERGAYVRVEHPKMGNRVVLGIPWKLSETPARIHRHAPLLGEHNEYVFGQLLGLSSAEIARLEEEGVIR